MAQRAYRSRKENAIQTLEKTVSDLQETNEEMSNAFMKLHDYAVSNGILDKAPDFARELRVTTEKFLSLARRSASEGDDSESPPGSPAAARKASAAPASSSREQDETKPSPHREVMAQPPPPADVPASADVGNTLWGYDLTSAVEVEDTTSLSPEELSMTSVQPQSQPQSQSQSQPQTQPTTVHAPLGYEIITVPTLDNASFPFTFTADTHVPDFMGGGSSISSHNNSTTIATTTTNTTASQPSTTPTYTPTYTPPSLSPYASPALPLPSSFAFAEVTFGRRLQRSALEVGYQLISMTNPPRDLYAQVFGFCLLFESVEGIRDRLRRGLEKTRCESLNYWGAPFWALGGIGQHEFGGAEQATQQQQRRQSQRPQPSGISRVESSGSNDDHNSVGTAATSTTMCPRDAQAHAPQSHPSHHSLAVGNQGTVDIAKHAFDTPQSLGPFDTQTTNTQDRCLDPRMRITLPGWQGEFYDPEEVELYLRGKGVYIRPGQDYVTAEVDVSWFEEAGAEEDQSRAAGGAGGSAAATAGVGTGTETGTPYGLWDPMGADDSWGLADPSNVFGVSAPVPGAGGLGGEAGWAPFAGGSASVSSRSSRRRVVTLDVSVFIKGRSPILACRVLGSARLLTDMSPLLQK